MNCLVPPVKTMISIFLKLSESDEKGAVPDLPKPKENVWRSDRGPIMPVPAAIRPTLSKYRIEVSILFFFL